MSDAPQPRDFQWELRDAVWRNDLPLARECLDAGASAKGRFKWESGGDMRPCDSGRRHSMLALYFDGCRHGAYVPYGGERNVHLPMMDLLLSHGAPIEGRGCTGTPLQHACKLKYGCLRAVRYLLDHGADVEAAASRKAGEFHWAPLEIICSGREGGGPHHALELATLLIDRGASVDGHGQGTPLSIVCAYNRLELARLLIDRGADVNLANCRQETPLMKALVNASVECVRLLLARGAEFERPRSRGRDYPEPIAPVLVARFRKCDVLEDHYYTPKSDYINTAFDMTLLAHLCVAGQRFEESLDDTDEDHLAARRRVLSNRDLTRIMAKFLTPRPRKWTTY